MAERNTVLEGSLKHRDGKKWKSRWCVISKLSPVADRLHISMYKDVKDYNKNAPQKCMISLEDFYGVESGFQLDKEQNVMAIICEKQTVILAFSCKDILQQWNTRIQTSLGVGLQYPVYTAQVPHGSKLPLGQACMHIHDQRVALTTSIPPKVLMTWNISHLRRFGDIGDKFVFEGGTSAGKAAGVHIFISDYTVQINQAYKESMDMRPVSKRDAIRRRSQSMASRNSQNSDNGSQSSPPRYVESPKLVKRHSESSTTPNKPTFPLKDDRQSLDYDFPPPARTNTNCSCSVTCLNNLGKNSFKQEKPKSRPNFSANITSSERSAHLCDRSSSSPENGFENLTMPKYNQRCQNQSFINNLNQKLSGMSPDYDIVPRNDYDTLPKSNQMVYQNYDTLPKSRSDSFSDYHVPTSNRQVSDDEDAFANVDNDVVGNKNILNKIVHSASLQRHGTKSQKRPSSGNSFEMVVLGRSSEVDQCDLSKNTLYIVVEPGEALPFVNLDEFDGSSDNNHHFVSYGYDNLTPPSYGYGYDNVPVTRNGTCPQKFGNKTWIDSSGYTHLKGESISHRVVNNNHDKSVTSSVDRCNNCGHPALQRQPPAKCPVVRAPQHCFSRNKSNFMPLYLDYDVPPPAVQHVDYDVPPSVRHTDYDVPHSYPDYDRPPPRTFDDYDTPPAPRQHQDYDRPPPPRCRDYDFPPTSPSNSNRSSSSHGDYHVLPARPSPKVVETPPERPPKSSAMRKIPPAKPPAAPIREPDYMLMKIDHQTTDDEYIQLRYDANIGSNGDSETNLIDCSPQQDYANVTPVKPTSTLQRNLVGAGKELYLAMKPGDQEIPSPLERKSSTYHHEAVHRCHSLKEFPNPHKPILRPTLSLEGEQQTSYTGSTSSPKNISGIVKPFDNLVPHEPYVARKISAPRSESPKLETSDKSPSTKTGFLSKLIRQNSRKQKQSSPENVPLTQSDDYVKSTSSLPEHVHDKSLNESKSRSNSVPEKLAKVAYSRRTRSQSSTNHKENQETPLLTQQTDCQQTDSGSPVEKNCFNVHSQNKIPLAAKTMVDSGYEDSDDVWTKRDDVSSSSESAITLSQPPKGKTRNPPNLMLKMPLDTVVESQQSDAPAATGPVTINSEPVIPIPISETSIDSQKSEENSRPKSTMSTTMRPRSGKEYQKVDRKKLVENMVTNDQNSPMSPLMTPRSPSASSIFTFDTISYVSSPSSRISKTSPDWMANMPMSLYMNLELSPPSTPNSPISIPEHKLNYAEIDLSSSTPSDNNAKRPVADDSMTNYAIIDMVATATAGRVGKEHAQWREDSLQLKPKT